MQTQPNPYKVRQLAGGKHSLVNDKGEVMQLLKGKFKRVKFDALLIFTNRRILGKFKQRGCYTYCLFNADLTPIALLIEGELRVVFGCLNIHANGKIEARHEGKWYGFNADLTPIA